MSDADGVATLTRVTLADARDAISVSVPAGLSMALIAALGSDPTTIENLLRAAEGIYHGAAEVIVGAIIAHDRAVLRWQYGLAPAPVLHPDHGGWAITSPIAFGLARRPASGGLLWFDLARGILFYQDIPWPIEPFGEIAVFDGQAYLPRTVTYDVRGRWKIEAIRRAR